ncbi:MAG: hypothetical protein JST00_11000 [Deltaproteobacteria bacterium]|nr:hypothetical protein [Deltaproteobacteria bacterium]
MRLRVTSIALAMLALAPAAKADESGGASEKERCVAAFDRGQRAQSDRALRRAQSELIACAQESCPAVLRADCAGVLAEVRRALPTLVLAADDGDGHELADVKVSSGGEVLATRLDGHAIPFDPGTFELTFEASGAAPVKMVAIVHEGEKSRVVRASLPGARGGVEAGDAGGTRVRRDALGWALPISLLAASAGAFTVAGLSRLSFDDTVDELRATCAPECSLAQRDDLSSKLVVSNVALGAGIGLAALAVVSWFLTAPTSPRTSRAHGVLRERAVAWPLQGIAW